MRRNAWMAGSKPGQDASGPSPPPCGNLSPTANAIRANNNGDGVSGISASGGAGVRGIANGANHDGVVGQSTVSGNGVLGVAANGNGLFGQTASGDGVSGISANGGAGVRGTANGANHDGVVGQSNNSGNGVLGWAAGGAGVFAVSQGGGDGVVARAAAGHGVNAVSNGGGHGVSGFVSYGDGSEIGNGVEGLVASGAGVLGTSASASVIGLVNPGGWHPETGLAPSPWSIGVCGGFQSSEVPLPWNISYVTDRAGGYNHYGVYGVANIGVLATTPFVSGYGLIACNTAGGNSAAFMGDVEITGNINLSGQINTRGQDCAEYFELANSCVAEAGNVLVVEDDGRLNESNAAYDRKVVCVVSGGGPHRPGVILGHRPGDSERQAAVALVGRVMCKVDADYAPVELGDLLTTSPTSGHAMKAPDSVRAFGCILGKALQPIRAGRALVPILVAMQ